MTYTKENPSSIQSLFDSIASRYDKTNALLSLGIHHVWNRSLTSAILKEWKEKEVFHLDLCAGTGEISRLLLKKKKKSHFTLVDFSSGMLEIARNRLSSKVFPYQSTDFIEADVEVLPLEEASFDTLSLSYGIRNVKTPLNALKEAFRVLKPEGKLFILELTRPKNPFFQRVHRTYLKYALPLMGSFATQNKEAYAYLSSSVNQFVEPNVLQSLLVEAGFSDLRIHPLTLGTATLFIATKKL